MQCWLCVTFLPFLLPQVYQAFSLGSSFAKVIKFDNMLRYSEFHVAKRSFPQVPSEFIDDLFQVRLDLQHLYRLPPGTSP